MILTEQQYKNLNRLYYHGQLSERNDESLKLFDCYYLSTDPYYAYSFARKNGVIKVHKLKKGLNICNLRSKQDKRKIKEYCEKHNVQEPLKFVETLTLNDWLGFFNNALYRDAFLITLQSLGYDGFFNIEDEDSLRGTSRRSENSIGFPSIGIFDKQQLILERTITGYSNFLKIPRIQDVYDLEIQDIKKRLYAVYRDYGKLDEDEVRKTLRDFEKNVVPVVQIEDVLYILNNFDPVEAKAVLKEARKLARVRLQDWNIRNPTNDQIEKFARKMLRVMYI